MKACLVSVLACAAACPSMAQTVDPIGLQVSITPRSTVLLPGQTARFGLHVTSDSPTAWLSGSVSLRFDADLLELSSVTVDAPHDLGGSLGSLSIENGVGTLSGIGFSTASGVAGGFDLASVWFTAKSLQGYDALRPFESTDATFAWNNVSGEPVVFSAIPGSVSVVPEPQVLLSMVMGLGLLGCAAGGRRWAAGPARRMG